MVAPVNGHACFGSGSKIGFTHPGSAGLRGVVIDLSVAFGVNNAYKSGTISGMHQVTGKCQLVDGERRRKRIVCKVQRSALP